MTVMEQEKKLRNRIILTGMMVFLLSIPHVISPPDAYSFAYHATTNAFAKRIMKRGITTSKFYSKARFGKKFYVSTRPGTALTEKGQRSSLIRMKTSKHLTQNSWDLRRPNPGRLRSYVGNTDLRGTVKNGVIGPKLGHRIGKLANQQGKAIKYRSVKNGGTNIAVPGSMISKHPRVLYHKTYY